MVVVQSARKVHEVTSHRFEEGDSLSGESLCLRC